MDTSTKLEKEDHVVETIKKAAKAAAEMHDGHREHISKEKEHGEKVEVHRRRESVSSLAAGIASLQKVENY